MAKIFLLTGPPGCGKTTILKRIIDDYPGEMDGFYTQELRQGGTRTGFEIVTLHSQRGILAHINIQSPQRVGKYGVDLNSLEDIGVGAIFSALEKRALVLIDEIGPMEIASAKFRAAVEGVIRSDNRMVATIVKRSLPFTDKIKQSRGVNLFEVDRNNRATLAQQILHSLHAGT